MALGILSGEFDRCAARDRRARPGGDGGRRGEGRIGHHHINQAHWHLQRFSGHLRQDGRRTLADIDVADVHLHTPSRRDTHFGLGFAPNAAFVDTQGHAHATAHITSGRAIALPPLAPADAFGAGQDTLPQRIAGEGQPTFHGLVRQELVARRGALARLSGVSDMAPQAVVERVEA